jgi:uncharacterized protein YutE (UPF0331/DUF86 family)
MVSGLSGQNVTIEYLFDHYNDLITSLRYYFSPLNPEFLHEPKSLIEERYQNRQGEVELSCSLSVLASLEASLRVDYLLRCKLRRKDSLSRALRLIYKRKKERASLEDDILKAWRENTTVPPRILGSMIEAFQFRNWLAHGRWWPLRGSRYDFLLVYGVATEVLNSLEPEGS